MVKLRSAIRQESGLFNVEEVARLAGVVRTVVDYSMKRGFIKKPTTVHNRRKYYTAEETEEIVDIIKKLNKA